VLYGIGGNGNVMRSEGGDRNRSDRAWLERWRWSGGGVVMVLPDTWKVVTVEGTSKEWEGRSCVVEGEEVAIEVGRVQVETRV